MNIFISNTGAGGQPSGNSISIPMPPHHTLPVHHTTIRPNPNPQSKIKSIGSNISVILSVAAKQCVIWESPNSFVDLKSNSALL